MRGFPGCVVSVSRNEKRFMNLGGPGRAAGTGSADGRSACPLCCYCGTLDWNFGFIISGAHLFLPSSVPTEASLAHSAQGFSTSAAQAGHQLMSRGSPMEFHQPHLCDEYFKIPGFWELCFFYVEWIIHFHMREMWSYQANRSEPMASSLVENYWTINPILWKSISGPSTTQYHGQDCFHV